MLLYQTFSIYYTWKDMKKSYKNDKFKISAPTWNVEFKLPGGSYSVSNIQDYFEYILKKHEENTDNPSIRLYVNKINTMLKVKLPNSQLNKLKSGIKNGTEVTLVLSCCCCYWLF